MAKTHFTGNSLDDVLNATAETNRVDLKEAFIRLKDKESVKVRVLSKDEIKVYKAHGSFDKGIYTQACKSEAGEPCPLCVASKVGGEAWNKELYTKTRVGFAFAILGTDTVKIFDASRNQAQQLASAIKEYEDSLDELAFTFKRTGNKSSTVYSLSPIIKMNADDKKSFESFNDTELNDEWWEARISPKQDKFILQALKDAKFPMELLADKFDLSVLDEVSTSNEITIDDDDLPF